MKTARRKITVVTAYDYSSALLVDKAGIDIVMVGDSGGMVVLGYDDTIHVTVDEMLILCKAVSKGAKRPLIVADLPFMSYNINKESAIRNAGRFIKDGGADAVKLEGGSEFKETARAIIKAGIPVMGHIGLTPQTAVLWSGLRMRGGTSQAAYRIIEDAKALDQVEVFSIVLESIPSEVAKIITDIVSVPTIGIGAGIHCDGQVLVMHDLLGLYDRFTPRFAKNYVNLAKIIQDALENYKDDVQQGRFPSEEHVFHQKPEEYAKLLEVLRKDRMAVHES